MKRILLAFVAVLAALVPALAQEPDPNFYIYLCFGQSNMEGNGQIEEIDRNGVDPRFQMMAAVNYNNPKRQMYNWYTATPPLVRESTGLCPADWFGRTMVANLPENVRVGVIVVAVGGASIDHLDKDYDTDKLKNEADWFQWFMQAYDKKPYGRLLACAKEAQKVGVIKGMLLHQGETDNGQDTWPQRVKKVYTDLLTDLDLEAKNVPLFVGETVRSEMGGACGWHNVNAIPKLKSVIPTSYVISAEDLEHKGDGLHFTSHAYRILGTRYAAKALSLMGIKDPELPYKDEKVEPIHPEVADDDYVFPFADFNPSIYGQGKWSKRTGTFTPGQWGCGGWEFDTPLDLSGYRFLIAELKNPQTNGAQLRVWDTDNYFDKSYECNFNNEHIIVAEINGMMKNLDSGIQPVNSTNITRVGIWANGSTDQSAKIHVKQVFATNHDPYSYINEIETEPEVVGQPGVYNLQGIRVADSAADMERLPRGLYIVDGRKVLSF